MNFILSTYIYPIQDKIIISEKFNFSLDNPRTNEEIEFISIHLEKSLNSPDVLYGEEYFARLPIYLNEDTKNFLSVESALLDFEKGHSKIDPFVKSFFKKHKKSNILKKLASMWVICRFDDEGQFENINKANQKMIAENVKGFTILDSGHPIVLNSENLINVTHLFSLLIHTEMEDYFGGSFISNLDPFSLQLPKINKHLNQIVLYFGLTTNVHTNHVGDEWKYFHIIKDKLIDIGIKLDNVINDNNKEKFLFISHLLKSSSKDIKDNRYKFLTIISIIELLLTHSPDYLRFNVEDSISKQFRLKTSVLIYQNNNKVDLSWLNTRLKDIYNQRSNIAHGNFKELDKFLQKEAIFLKKEAIYNEESIETLKNIVIDNLISDVYLFLRAIIEQYIKDPVFVNFLKKN